MSGGHYLAAAIVLALLIGGAVGLFFGVNAAVTEGAGLVTGLRWWLFSGAFIGLVLILDVGSAAALHRMINRVEALSVKTILKNLAQGERSSGEAEQFYTDQAEELRYLREEMAARTAERLKTNIVMPVFLMLMAIIIAALAPTIVSIRGLGFF